MAKLSVHLELTRCPHCYIDEPNLSKWAQAFSTTDHEGHNPRYWAIYVCRRCGGVVLAGALGDGGNITDHYPSTTILESAIPEKPSRFLQEAINTANLSPTASIMVSASAIDAMLKLKGLTEGSLYDRINKAAKEHLLTADMQTWAHQIRLDANDQRHADEDASMPNTDDAQRCVEFAKALAEYLFVLPAKVTRGIQNTSSTTSPT